MNYQEDIHGFHRDLREVCDREYLVGGECPDHATQPLDPAIGILAAYRAMAQDVNAYCRQPGLWQRMIGTRRHRITGRDYLHNLYSRGIVNQYMSAERLAHHQRRSFNIARMLSAFYDLILGHHQP